MAELKFEDAIKKLEEIVEALEAGEISLEDSMAKYEEGVKLAVVCQKRLEGAKKKIEVLIKKKNGEVKLEPFDADDAPKKKRRPQDEGE